MYEEANKYMRNSDISFQKSAKQYINGCIQKLSDIQLQAMITKSHNWQIVTVFQESLVAVNICMYAVETTSADNMRENFTYHCFFIKDDRDS